MQAVPSLPPILAPQPQRWILVSLWLSWQRGISNEEERGEGVVRGREVCVCAQTACKWDSESAASFAKEEQKPICCAGACVWGAAMCFSLVVTLLAHVALTGVWAEQQTGEPCLFSLPSYASPAVHGCSSSARFFPPVSDFLQASVVLL